MKKILAFLISIFSFVVAVPFVSAIDYNPPGSGVVLQELIANIFNVLLGVLGIVALLAFIWAGFTWMISAGDANKIGKAKKVMIWAVAGLVVIFTSYMVLTFVFNALGYATPSATS